MQSTSTWQYLDSPNYPRKYGKNVDISWQIRAQHGYVITLEVMDLDLEWCSACDYVEIYDGSSASSPLLATLTQSSDGSDGNNNGKSYYSTGSSVYVRFISDLLVEYRGFRMRYKEINPTPGLSG